MNTHRLELDSTIYFGVSSVPANRHATNWDKCSVFWITRLSYENAKALLSYLRAKDVCNALMKLPHGCQKLNQSLNMSYMFTLSTIVGSRFGFFFDDFGSTAGSSHDSLS